MHAMISEAEYRRNIAKTKGNAYLFFGEEDYLKAFAVKSTRERICPDEGFAVFNDIVIDATDFTPDKLLDAMAAPPMMAEEKLIVLRGLDFTAMKQGEVDALVETLALLSEYDDNTVLIYVAAGLIDAGYLPKRPSPLFKKLSEVATPVQFEASTEAKLIAWAGKHFAHLGVTATPRECAFLVSFAGRSMYLLAGEIEKIACFVLSHGRNTVTVEDVKEVAVPAADTDAFALSNAILAGKYEDAMAALSVMKFERVEPTVILGELSRTVCDMHATRILTDAGKSKSEVAATLKLHEYKAGLLMQAASRVTVERLARAVALCAEADFSLKRSAGDYSAVEKLICSL